MGKWRRRLDSIAFPVLLVIWVVSGVVLICQYKGMLPWLEQWPEAVIVLIVAVPVLLLAMYVIGQLFRIVLK
jgi:hypothetical protein